MAAVAGARGKYTFFRTPGELIAIFCIVRLHTIPDLREGALGIFVGTTDL